MIIDNVSTASTLIIVFGTYRESLASLRSRIDKSCRYCEPKALTSKRHAAKNQQINKRKKFKFHAQSITDSESRPCTHVCRMVDGCWWYANPHPWCPKPQILVVGVKHMPSCRWKCLGLAPRSWSQRENWRSAQNQPSTTVAVKQQVSLPQPLVGCYHLCDSLWTWFNFKCFHMFPCLVTDLWVNMISMIFAICLFVFCFHVTGATDIGSSGNMPGRRPLASRKEWWTSAVRLQRILQGEPHHE